MASKLKDHESFRCPYCRIEITMVQTIHGVWLEGFEHDTGERHYCAKQSSFDQSIQFQRQLIAEIKHGYESNVDALLFIDIEKRFMNRWAFFNFHALHLWVEKERRAPDR